MLYESIKSEILASLKKGDTVRTETLRFLVSAIRYIAIAKYGADWEKRVSDADVLGVVKQQVKTHHESIEAFEKAGRPELAANEKSQLAILDVMLPKQLTDEEIASIIRSVLAGGEKNFGKLMGQVMAKTSGNADGNRVASLLKTAMQT